MDNSHNPWHKGISNQPNLSYNYTLIYYKLNKLQAYNYIIKYKQKIVVFTAVNTKIYQPFDRKQTATGYWHKQFFSEQINL
jgi:hypothetical protein